MFIYCDIFLLRVIACAVSFIFNRDDLSGTKWLWIV